MKITQSVVNSCFGPLGQARKLTKKQRERFGDFLVKKLNGGGNADVISPRAARLVAEHVGRLPADDHDVPLGDLLAELGTEGDESALGGTTVGEALLKCLFKKHSVDRSGGTDASSATEAFKPKTKKDAAVKKISFTYKPAAELF